MKATKVVALLLLSKALIFASSQSQTRRAKKYEILLRDTIFKDYDIRSRPVEDYHTSVEVNFSISFQQMLQVDEKNQVITMNIWRSSFWKDEFLKWDPENYGNITQVLTIIIAEPLLFRFEIYFHRYLCFEVKFGSQISNSTIRHRTNRKL